MKTVGKEESNHRGNEEFIWSWKQNVQGRSQQKS
jgi:hypothetical protein